MPPLPRLLALLLAGCAMGRAFASDDLPIYSVRFHDRMIPGELRPTAQPMTRQAQRWLCHLNAPPPPASDSAPPVPQSKAVVAGKLQQLFGGRCFVASVGWWRYEYCGDKWVRQYHEEQGVVTAEFVLGLGPKALANDVLGNRLIQFRDGAQKLVSRFQGTELRATGQWEFAAGLSHTTPDPYYRTVFYDGTACDLTGGRREIEIQVHCAFDTSLDGSFAVVERATCVYHLVFHTAVLCSWPEVVPAAARRRAGVVPRSAAIDCYSDATAPDLSGADVVEEVPGGTEVAADPILAAFGTGCVYRFEEWWTYHFCWQRWLRQYRSEKEHVAMHLWLGFGPKAALRDAVADATVTLVDSGSAAVEGERTLWQLVEAKQPLKAAGRWFLVPHAAGFPPHYASVLPHGDFCAATGDARRTVVRLLCTGDPTQNHTFEVRETDQCEYSALFYSTVPCTWAPLKDAYKSRFLVLPEVPVPVRPRFPIESADAPGEPEGVPPGAGAEGTPAAMQEIPVEDKAMIDEAFAGGCFSSSHGWWTYEWCHDKWIKQFHQEKGIVLSEYFLGLGVHALAVDSIGKRKVTYADGARSALQKLERQPDPRATGKWVFRPAFLNQAPHYSTWYYDGTACENGVERSAEVRLSCVDDPQLDLTLRILEPRPCQYTVVVQSPRVCDWADPPAASA